MIYTLILENREYNPKIDYFVCKNLAEGLERGYYEEHIRAVYHKEESAKSDFEFMMIKIKEIFKLNDINNNAPMIVNNLYQCITNSNIDISFQLNDFSYLALKNNYAIIDSLKISLELKFILFQIVLFLVLSLKYDLPIIPYHFSCKNIFNNLINDSSDETIENNIAILVLRTMKLNQRHDISYSKKVFKILNENKVDLLSNTSILKIGIYGSFATGNMNEYSDLDLLVIMNEKENIDVILDYSYKFWSFKIDIPIDIKVITEKDLLGLNMKGLKKTLKYL